MAQAERKQGGVATKTPLAMDLIKGAVAAAEYIGVTPRAVYHMTASRQLPVIRKGRTLFYRKSDLESAFQSEPA